MDNIIIYSIVGTLDFKLSIKYVKFLIFILKFESLMMLIELIVIKQMGFKF